LTFTCNELIPKLKIVSMNFKLQIINKDFDNEDNSETLIDVI